MAICQLLFEIKVNVGRIKIVMSEKKEQIKATIDEVQDIIDLFYQQNDKEAFEKLDTVLENMTISIDNLELYKLENSDFDFDETKLCEILKESMEALQSDDKVLMADILQYDFIEYINELLEQMK